MSKLSRAERREAARAELKDTAYEIFIGVLSLLSIANIVLVFALADDPAMQTVLSVMNALFSLIFLGDFIYRIVTAKSASAYFFRYFGWADLLASLPFPQLKILRLFRVIRVFRLLSEVGGRTVWNTLVRDRADSALMTLLLMGVFVLQFGSLAVLLAEEDVEGANITTASDALWYTVVTISTVGYGDHYPVSQVGRFIGVLIIIVGVGIFGTFTGYLANAFLGSKGDEEGADATGAASDIESVDDEALAAPAAQGVAAGAASGAVAAGVRASEEADEREAEEDRDARIEQLLAQSEQALAEVRDLLARK
ncbi:ion transporter [Microbacterium sp. C7(2022)]|uniref:ion transporter n=1 Tax=Microbacterium sp. C7(2022) TaxID=2992759 RepID=UPI00237B5B09|nr:ion transporter [Microbacterium sp. C7(2022)]MDE0547643.1 ion transporter [Microbacterium sp. C7(2022)]